MLRSDSNSMSNDLNQLLERKNKLEVELDTKLSADYTELMKKVSEGFHGMQVSAVEYYKQKANEEMDWLQPFNFFVIIRFHLFRILYPMAFCP